MFRQAMPEKLEHMELHANLEEAPAGAKGATPMDTHEELKDNLQKFTDSVHQRASTVVNWMSNIEPMNTERSKKFLGCTYRV